MKIFCRGGGKIEIISSGYNTGSYSSIIIGGKEHSMNRTGLNIVVFDNDMHLVVDSVNFNTQYPGTTGYRDPGMTRSYLTQYKAAIVSNGK